jgi:hypothetical protein
MSGCLRQNQEQPPQAAKSLIIHPKSFISPLRASGSSSYQFKFKWGVRLRPTKNKALRTKNQEPGSTRMNNNLMDTQHTTHKIT